MSNLSPAASSLFGKVMLSYNNPEGGNYARAYEFANAMAYHSRKAGEWETARNYREVAAHLEPIVLELAN